MVLLNSEQLQQSKSTLHQGIDKPDVALLTSLIETLNATESTEEERLLGLEILGLYARDEHCKRAVTDAVEKLEASFEAFFNQADNACKTAVPGDAAWVTADRLHRSLLLLLFCLCDYSFQGTQLLECTNQQMEGAISALTSVFASQRAPGAHMGRLATCYTKFPEPQDKWVIDARVMVCGSATLLDLSYPDTFFKPDESTDRKSIKKLTAQFEMHIGRVISNVLAYPVIESATNFLSDWLKLVKEEMAVKKPSEAVLLPLFDTTVSNIMHFITNLLTYTHAYSSQLRKHVGQKCTILQEVVLPYLNLVINNLGKNAADIMGRESISKTLLYIIKTMSFVTFKINFFRPYLRLHNPTVQLLNFMPNLDILAAVIRLNINIEYLDDKGTKNPGQVTDAIKKCHTALSTPEKIQLMKRLNHPAEAMYPILTNNLSYKELQYAFESPVEDPAPKTDSFVFAANTAGGPKKDHVHGRKKYGRSKRNQGRRSYVGRQFARTQRQMMVDRYRNLKAGNTESAPSGSEKAAEGTVDTKHQVPVRSLLTRTIEVGKASGKYFSDSDEGEGEHEEPSDSEDDCQVQPEALTKGMANMSINKISTAMPVPPAFLCSWTKQLMTDPMISPYGDVFEKSTIMEHLEKSKSCPITNKELVPSDLVLDSGMKAEIEEFQFKGFFRR